MLKSTGDAAETAFPGWSDKDWLCSTIDETIAYLQCHEMGSSDLVFDKDKDRAAKAELIRRLRRMADRASDRLKLKPCQIPIEDV